MPRPKKAHAAAVLLALLIGFDVGAIEIMSERPHFLRQVGAALALLRKHAPDEYGEIAKYIGRIEEADSWHHSGMAAYRQPPTFRMDRGTASYSPTWAAGAIAHDACHSRLWHEYSRKHNTRFVPHSAWGGQQNELHCIRYQINVMRKLAAPQHEITLLEGQDGLHPAQRIPYPPLRRGYTGANP